VLPCHFPVFPGCQATSPRSGHPRYATLAASTVVCLYRACECGHR